jgi:hypothetical protein
MNVESANFSNSAESGDRQPMHPAQTSDRPEAMTIPVGSPPPIEDRTEAEAEAEAEVKVEEVRVPEPDENLMLSLLDDMHTALAVPPSTGAKATVRRIAVEVERICEKSDRIQSSGQIQSWKMTLAQHRLQKILAYYTLGARRGRVELHSHLSAIVYRHISRSRAQLGFQARYTLIEDFLQGFYIEVLKAFRKENLLAENFSPRSRLELSEYMAFSEQYAKRRINLPGRRNQQLIVLRAQGFAKRQPEESSVDIELAVESGKGEDADAHSRSPLVKQVREQMVADAVDLSDSVLRDRVVGELMQYLESQDQQDCMNYLTLKLQDLSAPEIDDILGLSPRQRDYLQQRFKYHVEKFARSHRWQLVHQWLGADLDQNLGMPPQKWAAFQETLPPDQRQLIQLKGSNASDQAIAKDLQCTPKQVHKRWVKVLELAWQFRNQD